MIRKPIAAVHIADPEHVSLTNPAGWLYDKSLDIKDAEGLKRRFFAWADTSIEVMREMDAEGMICWESDGASHGTYMGSPELTTRWNPEIAPWVKDWYAKFRKAGFLVGVCIRPKLADPLASLMAKAYFARKNWLCKLFYIDSSVDEHGFPLPATYMRWLKRAFPDCQFIPENESDEYWQEPCDPYLALENGDDTPGVPGKGVIEINAGEIEPHYANLVKSVRGGSRLLRNGSWTDERMAILKQIYAEARS